MVVGVFIMLASLCAHLFAIGRVDGLYRSYYPFRGSYSFRTYAVLLLAAVRAFSFLSNSYILSEGRVASFLLGTSGILNLWFSFGTGKIVSENFVFLVLNITIRFGIDSGMSKETIGRESPMVDFLSSLGIGNWSLFLGLLEALLILAWSLLVILLYMHALRRSGWKRLKYFFIMGNAWNLLSICLFFYTGHWCTFDGLRYAAAFIGFEQFNIVRQGILLTIDTFGVSHIIPILTLPFLVIWKRFNTQKNIPESLLYHNLSQMSAFSDFSNLKKFLSPHPLRQQLALSLPLPSLLGLSSLIDAVCLLATPSLYRFLFPFSPVIHSVTRHGIDVNESWSIVRRVKEHLRLLVPYVLDVWPYYNTGDDDDRYMCAIQRRHLMVWGLFAPKYVFDVLGLLLTDFFICLASLFYF
ncbi:hypothetical protein HPP92_010566 [Vanilla planifolia]|uniref:Uncharacterized protein n=1 Tax=Vanilla planifolia TaxID=51239 RepID=A0A835UZW8_VANPL|nr:hypothetical protein HPP92_010566 [Vanilla planifolia]